MCIEGAFGILTRRCWGILWRPLGIDFLRHASPISSCMRLENFCIDSWIAEAHLAEMDGRPAFAVPQTPGRGGAGRGGANGRGVDRVAWKQVTIDVAKKASDNEAALKARICELEANDIEGSLEGPYSRTGGPTRSGNTSSSKLSQPHSTFSGTGIWV